MLAPRTKPRTATPRRRPVPRWTGPGPMSIEFYFARALEIIHKFGLWARPSGYLASRHDAPEYRVLWGITESMPDCQATHGTSYKTGEAALRALRRAGRKLPKVPR